MYLFRGRRLAAVRGAGVDDVNCAVASAKTAFLDWGSQTSGLQRGRILQKASQLIRVNIH